MPTSLIPGRRVVAAALIVLAAGLTGCGPSKYPVRGAVALDDGTPVTRGLVVFERVDGGPPIAARGNIGPDGRYELSTDRPGDGVPPGRYKVLVNPMDNSDLPDELKDIPFDTRYLSFHTSGLECEVKGGETDYPIKLAKRAKKGRR